MSDALRRLAELLNTALARYVPPPLVAELPATDCEPAGVAGAAIIRDQSYFTATIHEVALSANQFWWTQFDPMVLTITEFIHGDGVIAVPGVVGPETIRKLHSSATVPPGIVLRNTPVSGPSPYRGGAFALTVMLYRVKVGDFAQRLLRVMEGLSTAIGREDISTLVRLGGAVVDGLETLIGLGDTVPIAGQRAVQDGDTFRGFRSAYYALIAAPPMQPGSLRVVNGEQLHVVDGAGRAPLTGVDYVLYSIQGRSRRGEFATLPFSPLLKEAKAAAAIGDEEGWKRARASLLACYQQMVSSDDLTGADADAVFDETRADLKRIYDHATQARMLSPQEQRIIDNVRERLNRATAALDS
ncbi:MAG TPA: hypothetical protein VME69_12975 [Methylocella sp.]|nr:hypothetical protein [Methylocella sp.]